MQLITHHPDFLEKPGVYLHLSLREYAALETIAKRRNVTLRNAMSQLLKQEAESMHTQTFLTRFSSLPHLTKREEAITALIARGYSNKKIADELFIKKHTVKIHIHNIFRKFNVRSRRDLALYFGLKFGGADTPQGAQSAVQ